MSFRENLYCLTFLFVGRDVGMLRCRFGSSFFSSAAINNKN